MILVVEDELQINRLLCDFLSEQGYQVCAEKYLNRFTEESPEAKTEAD